MSARIVHYRLKDRGVVSLLCGEPVAGALTINKNKVTCHSCKKRSQGKPAFTEGEWTLSDDGKAPMVRWEGTSNPIVDKIHGYDLAEAKANGRLITTAPKGYKLAQAIVEYFGEDELDELLTTDIALRDMARAIIAQADGR